MLVADLEKELAWAHIRACAERVKALSQSDRFWAIVRLYIAARRVRK